MTDAILDSVFVEAIVQGTSDARLDSIFSEVLITFAMDVYLDSTFAEALVLLEATGAAEAPWIPSSRPTIPMQVWFPDATSVPTVIQMGWGITIPGSA